MAEACLPPSPQSSHEGRAGSAGRMTSCPPGPRATLRESLNPGESVTRCAGHDVTGGWQAASPAVPQQRTEGDDDVRRGQQNYIQEEPWLSPWRAERDTVGGRRPDVPDLSPQQMGGDGSGGRWCPEVKEASAEFLSMQSRRAEYDVAADITVGPMSAGLLRRAGVGQPDPPGSGGGGEYVTLL